MKTIVYITLKGEGAERFRENLFDGVDMWIQDTREGQIEINRVEVKVADD